MWAVFFDGGLFDGHEFGLVGPSMGSHPYLRTYVVHARSYLDGVHSYLDVIPRTTKYDPDITHIGVIHVDGRRRQTAAISLPN